eukprot:GFUD01052492.1.p1 GENE.GFUD01052492.1~~GFUD01052492.1.p1  ORF type:complete len:172 (+),score=32.90 GFUD01052492.1:101-616(+)
MKPNIFDLKIMDMLAERRCCCNLDWFRKGPNLTTSREELMAELEKDRSSRVILFNGTHGDKFGYSASATRPRVQDNEQRSKGRGKGSILMTLVDKTRLGVRDNEQGVDGKKNFEKIMTNMWAQKKHDDGSSERDYQAFVCMMIEEGEVRWVGLLIFFLLLRSLYKMQASLY